MKSKRCVNISMIIMPTRKQKKNKKDYNNKKVAN